MEDIPEKLGLGGGRGNYHDYILNEKLIILIICGGIRSNGICEGKKGLIRKQLNERPASFMRTVRLHKIKNRKRQ